MFPKKIEETDAIFEQLAKIHEQTRENNTVLRLSLDAKAAVMRGMVKLVSICALLTTILNPKKS